MFKIAAFPKCYLEDICEGRLGLFEWIEIATELKADGLEMYSGFLESTDTAYLKKLLRKINQHGFEMPMMCYSPDFTKPDLEERKEEVRKQKEIIHITALLGGKFCRVLSGQNRPAIDEEKGIQWVVECIQSCLVTAEENNVILVMENHYKDPYWEYPEFAQKKYRFMRIVEEIDSPYFGVQFDPSNAILAGDDPIELLKEVKYKVKTVHASDRYLKPGTNLEDLRQSDGSLGYSPNLCHGVIGKGLNNYDAIMSVLKEVNFNSWISIEDGINGMEEMMESVKFLNSFRKRICEKDN